MLKLRKCGGRRNNKLPGYFSIALGGFLFFTMLASIKLIIILLAITFIIVGISILKFI